MKSFRGHLPALLPAILLLAACAGNAPDTSAHQQSRADRGQAELDTQVDRYKQSESKKDE